MRINEKKLKIAMARKCWSFSDLAEAAGINRSAIYQRIRAKNVRTETLGELAKVLEVPVEEIVI
ncbi:MAG: helix-turn-helix transcriptional regulator [Chitinispirillales bacterium]|nr:helix-turn-helix transcriptional regulator [Chitinispirillales bacterium]